jgi:hypothetical protein
VVYSLAGYLNNIVVIGAIIICTVLGSFVVIMRKSGFRGRR